VKQGLKELPTYNNAKEERVKKAILITCVLLLGVAGVSADDLTGRMTVSGYVGYALGFGDAFEDYEGFGTEVSVGPTINFGGQFSYGVKENLMVGGELYFQSIKSEVKSDFGGSASESDMNTNVLGNVLYAFNHTSEKALFGIAGLGLYDGDLGLHAGIIYQTAVSESITLFGMPRLHALFTDPSGFMLQLSVGATFPIGN
jgi:hypothetical protein